MDAIRTRYVLPADPRFGRHVNHDPRSRRFPVRRRTPAAQFQSTRHVRHVPVFDQGQMGSCTGNAGLGCLGTGVFFATMDDIETQRFPWTQEGAIWLYSEATQVDDFGGTYPPEDTGSDGLSIAKVLHRYGLIAGYEHAFGIEQLIQGLMSTPAIVGTEWTEAMSEPDADGVIHPSGPTVGGHEYIADELVRMGDPFGPQHRPARGDMIGFTNSWGTSWGDDGRCYMDVYQFGELLARQGDATFFTPSDAVPPQPLPEPEADEVLASAMRTWLAVRGL